MDNLKQKIDTEIGSRKWNDALTEAIHQKTQKKSLSAYGIVTFCAVALACFLLVLNLQPAPPAPVTGDAQLQTISVKEMYVADGALELTKFSAIASRLYLSIDAYTKSEHFDEIESILSAMQPIEAVPSNQYDMLENSKDVLLVDANEQAWRLKLFIQDTTDVSIYNVDTLEWYIYENEKLSLYQFIDSTNGVAKKLLIAIFVYMLVNALVQFYFQKVYNIHWRAQTFEEKWKNRMLNLFFFLTAYIFFNNSLYKWVTFIPVVVLPGMILIGIYLLIVYRYQSRRFFQRECFIALATYIFLCYAIIVV